MRKLPIFYFLIALLVVIFLHFGILLYNLPTAPCEHQLFIVTNSEKYSEKEKYYIHPEKIVIEPWKGQHHVYGLFMLPEMSTYDLLMTVNLSNNQIFCGNARRIGKISNGITAKPGYVLLKGYLQTRTAIQYILKGKINDLQNVKNWQLVYVKNEK